MFYVFHQREFLFTLQTIRHFDIANLAGAYVLRVFHHQQQGDRLLNVKNILPFSFPS